MEIIVASMAEPGSGTGKAVLFDDEAENVRSACLAGFDGVEVTEPLTDKTLKSFVLGC